MASMKITRVNPLTGKSLTLDLNITDEQFEDYLSGTFVQHAFPNLNADEREFIISGIPPGEYDKLFCGEEK